MKTPDTINGKTPEDIKKDAETCLNFPPHAACNLCQLFDACGGIAEHIIKELYDLVLHLESRLAKIERERNTAVKDLNGLMSQLKGQVCNLCRKSNTEECNWGEHLYHYCTPEWRGVCGENTKEKQT